MSEKTRFYLLLIFLVSIGMGVFPGGIRGQEDEPRERERIHPGPKEYALDVFAPHMWEATKSSFGKKESLIALGIGSALTAAVYTQDEAIDDYWDDNDLLGVSAPVGDNFGAGWVQAVTCVGLYGWAQYKDDQELATTAEVLTEAMLIQMIVINGLKPLVGRERPEEQNNLSFPSGHTGAAFTMAAVLDHRMGHEVGMWLYALAILTGLERMQDSMHYASDVTMGATIALVVGYQTSRYHDDHPYEKAWHSQKLEKVSIMPYFPEDDGFGFVVSMPLD